MPEYGIRYADHGGGGPWEGDPPLLLIHGAGGNRFYWPPELRRLEATRVLAPDLPGHGRSSGAAADTIGQCANTLLGWLDQLAVQRAVWAGHSMGGAIALQAALHSHERVAGLILVSTGGRLRVHPDLLTLSKHPQDLGALVELIVARAFSEEAPATVIRLAAERLRQVQPEVLHRDFLACDRFDLLDRLGEIEPPALVIAGTADRLTPVKFSRYLADHLPQASLHLIEGAGHMVMLERPGEVTALVREFLERLPGQAQRGSNRP